MAAGLVNTIYGRPWLGSLKEKTGNATVYDYSQVPPPIPKQTLMTNFGQDYSIREPYLGALFRQSKARVRKSKGST